jgi:hypothetical protein
MSKWQPVELCPENTWVLIYVDWDDEHPYRVGKFQWVTDSSWETVSESSGASGARRQVRQEKIERFRQWDDGTSGPYPWMPLPEPPLKTSNRT